MGIINFHLNGKIEYGLELRINDRQNRLFIDTDDGRHYPVFVG